MDVEKTIEFILATEARTVVKLEALTERMDRAEKRLEADEQRLKGAELRLEGVENRMERAEKNLETVIAVLGEQQAQVATILGAIGTFTETQRLLFDRIDSLTGRVDSLAKLFEDWLRRGGNGSRPN